MSSNKTYNYDMYNPGLIIEIIDKIFAEAKLQDSKEILTQNILCAINSCNKINDDAKKRLKTEFNKNCEVKSEVAVTETGTVKGVLKMEISGDKPDAVAIGRIREVYGADEVNYVGVKKTAQKS